MVKRINIFKKAKPVVSVKPAAEHKAEPKAAPKGAANQPGFKKPAKIIDVAVHTKDPAAAMPARAASKQIIVTHKPMIKDPDVHEPVSAAAGTANAGQAEAEDKKEITATKIVIKPLADAGPSEIRIPGFSLRDSPKIALAHLTVKDAAADSAGDAKAVDIDEAAADSASDDQPSKAIGTTADKPNDEPEEVKVGDIKKPLFPTRPPDPLSVTGDMGVPDEPDALSKETAAIEARVKQQESFDALVESKQYFLPIDTIDRRRSKIVTICGIVLIAALGLLLVNLLMDVGYISIPGVHPVTRFFNS